MSTIRISISDSLHQAAIELAKKNKITLSQFFSIALAEKISALTVQKAEVDKEVAVLSQALEATKTELKTTQDKVTYLTDENKAILQEKAVIQGQFKQLQGSL